MKEINEINLDCELNSLTGAIAVYEKEISILNTKLKKEIGLPRVLELEHKIDCRKAQYESLVKEIKVRNDLIRRQQKGFFKQNPALQEAEVITWSNASNRKQRMR